MNQDNDSDPVLSKFLKVYLSGETGDDLELPISLNSFLPKTLPKTVIVRSIYGKIWRLVLRKCGGDDVEKYVLVNGWKRIVKDEDLKDGDFLAFEFDGSRYFNFCIYEGFTMCKRLRRSSVQSDETNVESDGEEEEETQSSDDHVGDDYTNDDASDETNAVEDEKNPEKPYFTMTLNPNKKSQLKIPAEVIKDYGLNFPERITVIDPLVHRFGAMEKDIKIQKNGCIFVKSFGCVFRRNEMKTTDKMICEVKKTDTNLVHTIKVSIIRG